MLKVILRNSFGDESKSKNIEWVDAHSWAVSLNGNLLCQLNDGTEEKPHSIVAEFAHGEWVAVKQAE